MVCQKCGTEMNTVYQHELQNISEKHLKYIAVLGAIPFGFVAIWICKCLWNKKDVQTFACPNCGEQYTIDMHMRRREFIQSKFLMIFGMVAAVIFSVVLVYNVSVNIQNAKLQFHREAEFEVVETDKIKVHVGEKKKIKMTADSLQIYSFKSANKKIATVNNKKRMVTGKKVGTTTIKVYKKYKKKSEYIGSRSVTVKKKGSGK